MFIDPSKTVRSVHAKSLWIYMTDEQGSYRITEKVIPLDAPETVDQFDPQEVWDSGTAIPENVYGAAAERYAEDYYYGIMLGIAGNLPATIDELIATGLYVIGLSAPLAARFQAWRNVLGLNEVATMDEKRQLVFGIMHYVEFGLLAGGIRGR